MMKIFSKLLIVVFLAFVANSYSQVAALYLLKKTVDQVNSSNKQENTSVESGKDPVNQDATSMTKKENDTTEKNVNQTIQTELNSTERLQK